MQSPAIITSGNTSQRVKNRGSIVAAVQHQFSRQLSQ
jgi:hypothetical protein